MWRHLAPVILVFALANCGATNDQAATPMDDFSLSSSAFQNGATIPKQFTCDGEDQPPPLQWTAPPPGTKSLALVVDDPDAPGGVFRHWGVYDIPASARSPDGPFQQSINDFGKRGYGGPCPPKGRGAHRYQFKLYALDVDRLNLSNPKVRQVETE